MSLDPAADLTATGRPPLIRKWRVLMASVGLLVLMIPLVAFGLGSAFSSLTGNTLEAALNRNAAETARNWASYFAARFNGFERVLETGALTVEQRRFAASARQVGQIYRFKLYDVRGRLVLASDTPLPINSDPGRRSHDVLAVRVVQTGKGLVTLAAGEGLKGDPQHAAAAYVPVNSSSGEPLGVMAVYVDQTATRNAFKEGFDGLSLKLSSIAAVVFLIPALGFAWRNVQAARRALHLNEFDAQNGAEFDLLKADRERLGQRLAAAESQLEIRTRELGEARKRGTAFAPPMSIRTIGFDDWLVKQLEEQIEAVPDDIDVECRLSLGDLDIDCDPQALGTVLAQLLGETAAAFAGRAEQGKASLVISTRQSPRGVELSLTARGCGPAAGRIPPDARQIMQWHGGGIETLAHPVQGWLFIAWWPGHQTVKKAA